MVIMQPGLAINPNATTSAQLSSSNPGQVFASQGNDFLSPASIQGNVDSFSKSGMVTPDMFGKNPSSADILKVTKNATQNIFTNPFGVTNLANIPTATTTTTTTTTTPASTTTTGTTGTSNSGNAGAVQVTQTVQTPSPQLLSDLLNYNPLMWVNPSATNVNLGTMDAFNKVMGGNGIFTPPVFNTFPLYPFIAPLQPPFTEVSIPTTGSTVNSLPQALLFPNTSQSGVPLWLTQSSTTTTIPINADGTTGATTTTTTVPVTTTTGSTTGSSTINFPATGGTTSATTSSTQAPMITMMNLIALMWISMNSNNMANNSLTSNL